MSIDWTKAPEGANKAGFTGPDNYLQFYRIPGRFGDYDYWSENNGLRGTDFPTCANQLFERPAKVEWDGQGLPPVGTVCEFAGGTHSTEDPFDKDLREGDHVTIIAHFKDGDLDLAAFTFNPQVRNHDRGTACVEQGAYGCFRPLRTPEQIAAEEREKAALEMAALMSGHEDRSKDCFKVLGEILYDAGYRRQEEGK
ncbi:hypothetical protein [Pseudomonas aeruginosa]|uniref:hypothetical protein n=1 Tax=Pseudomonas aeruginosa TaxID=287 RepID=UPI003F1CF3FB